MTMMTPKGVAGLLCLFCVLFVSQVSTLSSCGTGWFGQDCQYKCRCSNNSCDNTGLCTGSSKCLAGWFGLGCQYADVGFNCADIKEITDANDHTCAPATSEKTVTVSLNTSNIFTWMRVVVSMPDFANKIDVSFLNSTNALVCGNRKTTVLDNTTSDIFCEVNEAVDAIILAGDGVSHLCSVYVSGGRNVALKEKVQQSSTYSEKSSATFQLNVTFSASKAVDGGTSQELYNGFSCSVTTASPNRSESWQVTFASPRNVTRYVIYGRLDAIDSRLCGFSLESHDGAGNKVYEYTNSPGDAFQEVYTLFHNPLTVSKVNINAVIFPKVLSLCEVEIYGDSVCEEGKYGLDCEAACQCPSNSICLVSTGQCFSENGDNNTDSACPPGRYGPSCRGQCSKFCANVPLGANRCHGSVGACTEGCVDGYKAPTCIDKCDKGMFGASCMTSCSQKCQVPTDPDVSPCHHVSGICVAGCTAGAKGPTCLAHKEGEADSSSLATTSTERSSFIVYTGGAIFTVILLLLMFLMRKKTPPARPHIEELHPR